MPDLLPASRIGLHIEGSGPPIVLLHSSMSSKSQWRELIESLRGHYRLIAIDLLGHGESDMPSFPPGYTLRDEVHLVESVLALELHPDERFHLIGHSYGGMVALQVAAQSQRVRSLALFEPIDFHLLPAGDPDLTTVETLWREIEHRVNAGNAHAAAACFVDYWSGAGAFAQLRTARQLVLAALVPKLLLELRAVANESRLVKYRRIDVPTCLVSGLWSPEPAQRLTSIFTRLLPQASCFEVAAGHMAPITHPALVNPIFEEFIRAVDAGERRQARARSRSASGSWRNRARAIAFGLSGIALSVLPLFAMQDVARHYFGISPDAVYPLAQSAWHDAPPGMPPGGSFAVLSGDPLEAGPFVMRVRLPPGYVLPPYRRSNEAQMIVLAGAITVGSGEPGMATVRRLTSGSYVSLAARERHFAFTENGAVVQIFGMGPFGIGG